MTKGEKEDKRVSEIKREREGTVGEKKESNCKQITDGSLTVHNHRHQQQQPKEKKEEAKKNKTRDK